MGKIIGENKLFVTVYIPVTELENLFAALNNLVSVGILRDYEYRFSHYKGFRMRQTIAYKRFVNGKWTYPHEKYMQELHEFYEEIKKRAF